MRKKKAAAFVMLVSVAVLTTAMWGGSAGADAVPRYRVRIVNLTEGQPLTPPVIATHRFGFDLFEVGDLASVGVMQVAENGNVPNLVSALEQANGVARVVAGTEPLVPAGLPGSASHSDRATFVVGAPHHARFISFVSMLICTNDGFTGISRVWLPKDVGDSKLITANGYDAGTEVNTERFRDLVPPCQSLVGVTGSHPGTGASNPMLLEGGVIHHHPGISGGAGLRPAVHGWDDPVVRIRITRVA